MPGAPQARGAGPLVAWAAVGPVPDGPRLPPDRRVHSADVPLHRAPPWLGVDRALAGWWAWRQSGAPVLVADAGTALSLTRVGGEGWFAGGRLLAGAALQLRALQGGTAGLPAAAETLELPAAPWPGPTAEAMAAGVLRGLAAAVAQAAREAWSEQPDCRIWITGGDGALLLPLVRELLAERASAVQGAPGLVLEALAALRPAQGR